MKCIFVLILVSIIFKHPKYTIRKSCVYVCARHGRGGDGNLFVRKGGASQKKIGKHWYKYFIKGASSENKSHYQNKVAINDVCSHLVILKLMLQNLD